MPRLKYPEMRMELLGYLRKLKDLKYQMKAWVNHDSLQTFNTTILIWPYISYLTIRILAVMLVCRSVKFFSMSRRHH